MKHKWQTTAAVLGLLAVAATGEEADRRIPIDFELQQPGLVTLVIEDADGRRVRNLISEEAYPAGRNRVWWDGKDDRERDKDAAAHSVFHIPGRMVAPGRYTVRGLVHPEIDVIYQLTPYTEGKPPWRTPDQGSQWLTNHSAPSDVVFLPAGQAPERAGKPGSKGGQLLVCSRVAEGGSGLAWLDLEGRKLWGQHWLGGVWTAASHLAVDRGDRPVPGTYAYAAASWPGDKYNNFKNELRIHRLLNDRKLMAKAPRDQRFGTGEDRPILTPTYEIPLMPGAPVIDKKNISATNAAEQEKLKQYVAELSGFAAHNGILAVAFEKLNQLLFVDAHENKVLGTAEAPAPRGLAFDREGNLYVLSQGRVLRYETAGRIPLPLPEARVIVSGLEDPQRLMVADDHTIYLSDWGNSHQIKQFSADGKALRTFGDPGAPSIGAYNPNHLNHPSGMALDERGRLWVAEDTHIPKRVSIWDAQTGKLLDGLYGPMRYGGSGAVDPADKTRFFYDDDHGGTIEFKLDYETGRSTPLAIPYLERYNRSGLIGRYTGAAPSYPLRHNGRLYLTDTFNLATSGRRSAALWRYDDDHVLRLVAAAGDINDAASEVLPVFRDRPDLQTRMPEGFKPGKYKSLLFVWSDLNGNQQLDPEEVQFLLPGTNPNSTRETTGTATPDSDLAFTFSDVGGKVLQIRPVSITDQGVPVYDLAQRKVLSDGAQRPASSGGNQVLTARDGWSITTTPVKPFAREGLGGIRNGEAVWYYPSLWPGLHASHIAPMPEEPGQVIGTTRVVGPVIDAPPGSEAGQLWAINGNKGNVYIFTTDGLFVTRLFQDSRTTSWNAPQAERGMKVNHLSLQEECFGPTWTRTDKGEVILQCGFTGNIVEIKNLDQIRRLPDQQLTVSAEQLENARQWGVEQEARRQAEAGKTAGPLTVPFLKQAPKLDGDASDWEAPWALIDRRKQKVGNWGKRDVETRAKFAVGPDGKLYAAWQTYDQNLLKNSGESLERLFKCGGALDLLISSDESAAPDRRQPVRGDRRLLITRVGDRTVAMLYEPVAPGAGTPKVEFGSPLRTLYFDRVEPVGDRIELTSGSVKDLKADANGTVVRTTYELAIPLELLGLDPKPGQKLKFDVGILRGDGIQTLQRVYWRNRASGLVSDIPSEAELIPALWGELLFGDRN